MGIHRGEVLKKAIKESGIAVTVIAKRAGVSHATIYNWYEVPNLEIENLLKVGKAIKYDFTDDLREDPDFVKYLKEPEEPYRVSKLEKCEEERDMYMKKYIKALEDYNNLIFKLSKNGIAIPA